MISAKEHKYAARTTVAKVKDASLPPEEYLEVDLKQLNDAKAKMLMRPMTIKFILDGADRTISDNMTYAKLCKLEGAHAQMTIQELRELVAKQEEMDVKDVNLYVKSTIIPNHLRIGQCFADWMGFGLESWPPQFIAKPRIRGFEVVVTVPAMRDTMLWHAGTLLFYGERALTFDVEPSTTTCELKEFIFKQVKIPAHRQILTALIHKESRSVYGDHVALDDDSKTLSDFGVDASCAKLIMEKNPFDENGMYVFDDCYWDEQGYHLQPENCWIPSDSIANRARPDAHQVDPNSPAAILTDRAASRDAKEAEANAKRPK